MSLAWRLGSRIGELAARWDIVLDYSPEARADPEEGNTPVVDDRPILEMYHPCPLQHEEDFIKNQGVPATGLRLFSQSGANALTRGPR